MGGKEKEPSPLFLLNRINHQVDNLVSVTWSFEFSGKNLNKISSHLIIGHSPSLKIAKMPSVKFTSVPLLAIVLFSVCIGVNAEPPKPCFQDSQCQRHIQYCNLELNKCMRIITCDNDDDCRRSEYCWNWQGNGICRLREAPRH